MARQLTNAKPKNMKKTLSSFKKYIGNHKYAFVFIGLLVILSTSISLWGTYQIKTVVNRYVLKNRRWIRCFQQSASQCLCF